jgi:hypothetical protein
MRRHVAVTVAVLLAGSGLLARQDLPKNNTGENEMFAATNVQARTPYEEFADRLKLDAKTQAPAAQQAFSGAMAEAAPIGQRMLLLRQQMVNVSLGGNASEMQPVLDAYAASAAQMAAIEARAFKLVYGTLKPNQQSNAPQAFALMAGMFQASPAGGGRAGQRRGGGQ